MNARGRIHRSIRLTAALVLGALALPGSASGAPTDLPIQEQVALFEERLESALVGLEVASEELNATTVRLEQIERDIEDRQARLEDAREEYAGYRSVLDARIRAVYRTGPLDFIELLLGAKSIPELIDTYEFIVRTTEEERAGAAALIARKASLEDELYALRQQELEARAVEFELTARQAELEARRIEYERLFERASSEVLDAFADNEARRREVDRAAVAAIRSGEIVVEPGGVVETALAYLGIPYVWGGESRSGMDCSGLVLYVFAQHGVALPHYSGSQAKLGIPIPVPQLEPGDVVFFGTPVHHVGIYAGGGYFIHAPTFGDVVKVTKLNAMRDYSGARRYDWSPRTGPVR